MTTPRDWADDVAAVLYPPPHADAAAMLRVRAESAGREQDLRAAYFAGRAAAHALDAAPPAPRVTAGEVLAEWFAREVASAAGVYPDEAWAAVDAPWWDDEERAIILDALRFVDSLRGVLAYLSGTDAHDPCEWHGLEAEHFLGLEPTP